WQPTLTFEEGLEKTVDWYLSNESWMKRILTGEYEKYYEKQYLKR
ncbi:MAG: dTDP-glucose 4,6-dehydratase, partial [Bacteroidota bacterium]